MRLLKNQRGLTLIELLVVLAVLGLVLALGYNFYYAGATSFTTGESQYNVQQNVRLAADFVTREVRTASSLQILDSLPAPDNKKYIYIEGDTLKYRKGNETPVDVLNSISSGVSFTDSEFSKGPNENVLAFKIDGSYRNQHYFIESQVQCLNTGSIGGEAKGKIICYSNSPAANDITEYKFASANNAQLPADEWEVTPRTEETSITVWVPHGTDVRALKASFITTGAEVKVNGVLQKSGVTANNFTNPVIYSVTAENGSVKNYTVTVKVRSNLPPAANNVKITLNGAPIQLAKVGNVIEGYYEYVHPQEPEGNSLRKWYVSDTVDGEYTEIPGSGSTGKVSQTATYTVPSKYLGKFIKFEVTPVTQGNLIGVPLRSNWINVSNLNQFMVDLVNQIAVLFRTDYAPVNKLNFDTEELKFSVVGTQNASGGSSLMKKVSDFYFPEGADVKGYTLIVDAKLLDNKGGYGILLNGKVNQRDKNKDSGYMLQFDPGANSFLIRKIVNGNHDANYSYGATPTNQDGASIKGVYAPNRFVKPGVSWDWTKRYKTEITMQVQEPDGDLIVRVRVRDLNNHLLTEEMWFGNFGKISLKGKSAGYREFTGLKMPIAPSEVGDYFGLRTWQAANGKFDTQVFNVEVAPGFLLIGEPEFISDTDIKVHFYDWERQYEPAIQTAPSAIDKSKILYAGNSVKDAKIEQINGVTVLRIGLNNPVNKIDVTNGVAGRLTLQKGAVKQYLAGTVNIQVNKIERDMTKPVVETAVKNFDKSTIQVKFSENLDPSSAQEEGNYKLGANRPSKASLNGSTVTLSFTTSISNTNRLEITNVKDVAGNVMEGASVTTK